ncbi:TatD family hydrolase [Buchnera aphidicola]|uniref:TatD family hydrolase n=1 Tax=Buchnera aphidicola TaxID=9 RepID=UPI0031B84109
MFLIDSHCHLDRLKQIKQQKNGIKNILKKAKENNVHVILTIATSITNFLDIQTLIGIHKNILYSCGIHPLYIKENNVDQIKKLEKFSQNKYVIALGETGLDYYYTKNNKNEQKYVFRKHIHIGIKLNKPIIIHARESINDIISILKEKEFNNSTGVIHSFTGDISDAKKILDLGFYISFSGIITFKNSDKIRQSIKYIPLDRMLIETDAPYLSPVPYRGHENHPAYLKHIAYCITKIKNIDLGSFSSIIKDNFYTLFKIKN